MPECEYCRNWRYLGHPLDELKRLRGYYKKGECLYWRCPMHSVATCPKHNKPMGKALLGYISKTKPYSVYDDSNTFYKVTGKEGFDWSRPAKDGETEEEYLQRTGQI